MSAFDPLPTLAVSRLMRAQAARYRSSSRRQQMLRAGGSDSVCRLLMRMVRKRLDDAGWSSEEPAC